MQSMAVAGAEVVIQPLNQQVAVLYTVQAEAEAVTRQGRQPLAVLEVHGEVIRLEVAVLVE